MHTEVRLPDALAANPPMGQLLLVGCKSIRQPQSTKGRCIQQYCACMQSEIIEAYPAAPAAACGGIFPSDQGT